MFETENAGKTDWENRDLDLFGQMKREALEGPELSVCGSVALGEDDQGFVRPDILLCYFHTSDGGVNVVPVDRYVSQPPDDPAVDRPPELGAGFDPAQEGRYKSFDERNVKNAHVIGHKKIVLSGRDLFGPFPADSDKEQLEQEPAHGLKKGVIGTGAQKQRKEQHEEAYQQDVDPSGDPGIQGVEKDHFQKTGTS